MSISAEKIAYLRGLTDGLNLSSETNEGKLLLAIVDAIEAVSSEKELLESRIDKMGDYMDEMDELINQIADDVYEDENENGSVDGEFDYDEENNSGEIEFDQGDNKEENGKLDGKTEFDDEDDAEGDVDFFSTVCPHCGSYIAITGDVSGAEETIDCPTCGKPLFKAPVPQG